jgi:methionyl-tRNA synthetase
MPESKDSDWDWEFFHAHNNNELVANWGNLANRVLSFSYKHWEGKIPDVDVSTLREPDLNLRSSMEAGFASVSDLLEAVKIRAALNEAMRLATEVNKYLDTSAPWKELKVDREEAGKSIYTALKAIDSLKIIFAPFLPFTSEKLNQIFGYETPLFGEQFVESVEDALGEHTVLRYKGVDSIQWKPSELKPGAAFNKPEPLFKKLDKSVVEEERARLG